MPRFIYVGTGKAAKVSVKQSPAYGKVPIPQVDRKGIIALRVNADAPLFEEIDFIELGDVAWVESHPANGHVYATWSGNKVGAFSVGGDGKLKLVNTVEAVGGMHHMTVSPDGAWLLAAGYMSANIAVFPIAADGSVGAATDSKHHHAPMKESLVDRQEQCHCHQIMFVPFSPRWTLTCDLGADCVWVYGFDVQHGSFVGALNSDRHVKFPEGSGPRHLACHPTGRWVYVLCELDGQVVTCDWDGVAGRLTRKASANMLPDGVQGSRAHHSGASAIRAAPDGKTVYASHRTDDTVVVFSVDSSSGVLQKKQALSCAGVTPRDMQLEWALGDDGKQPVLRIGNQDSQSIATFAVRTDGLLDEQPAIFTTTGACPTCLTQTISPPPWVANPVAGQKRSAPP